MKKMEFRIGFRINLHLVLNDNKMETQKEKEQETKEDANRKHLNAFRIRFQAIFFALIQNLVAFNLVYKILLLWDLGRQNKLPEECNGSITLNSK